MRTLLTAGLKSRRGIVRKATAATLRLPKFCQAALASGRDFDRCPAVFANSFPKSGTHLLDQLVDGLPGRVNYGAFLSSMTSSFQFRERTDQSVTNAVRRFAPGEIVRGHLFHKPSYETWLRERRTVHYFIYRDPRAVVVSEAHYLRDMNRWHRLHSYFRRLPSIDDAIALSITGFEPPLAGLYYPNIAERFARYEGWLHADNCLAVRYENLMSEKRPEIVRQMARFYAERTDSSVDVDQCVAAMLANVAPQKSHTFRSAKSGGWREAFTPRHHALFARVAGDLLERTGFESRRKAAPAPAPAAVAG